MMLNKLVRMRAALAAVLLLSGCATMPTGPSVLVLPGPGKSFEHFQADDYVCRRWAEQQIGMTAQQAADESTVKSAAVGTAIGASVETAGFSLSAVTAPRVERGPAFSCCGGFGATTSDLNRPGYR